MKIFRKAEGATKGNNQILPMIVFSSITWRIILYDASTFGKSNFLEETSVDKRSANFSVLKA